MITEIHRSYLTDHAVTQSTIERLEIRSEENEIVFPWRDGDLLTEQRRPWPGDSGQYFWEADKPLHFWNLRDAGAESAVLLVEGTKQSLAAASWAPEEYSVLGMAGCEGWSKCDLSRFENRDVYLCLDADAGSNLSVYEAGDLFAAETEFYGARVKFLWLPARGSAGMDDVLAKHPDSKRTSFVSYLVGKAQTKPAERRPVTRKGARLDTILPDTGDRVGVAVNIDRKEVIDKITGALKDKLDGTELFNYGEILTRVRGHETVPLDKDRFHALIADAVACYNYTAATDKKPAVFEPRWPDPQTIGAVMSKADDFSPLKRVVRVPFLRPDGTVVMTEGYDRETATVLVLNGLEVDDVPSDPTQEETRAAAKFLMEEWLGDFPFPTEADRANALALVLTPFMRGLVPLAPLAVINGLEMGVGKNLINDCVCILATGEAAMPLPWVGNDEEMRKQITAAFAGGSELFTFDEAHVIEGAQMARALTSLTYGDRVLGVSRIAKFPNSATWVAMGNQVQVNGDMSRRVYFIALRPVGTTLADRDARAYRHEDIKLWTTENRPRLVAAALTVLRGWFAAGCPRFTRGASMGSFEPWDRLLSGALAYAGYPAFLTDMKERRSESDFEGAYWAAHVHWLHGRFGGNEFTTRQVQEDALRDPAGYEAPPGMEDPAGKSYTRALGKAYARHVDRRYEGITLHKAGMGHRSTIKWTTTKDGDGGMEGTEGEPTPPAYEKNVTCDVVREDASRVRIQAAGPASVPSLPPAPEPTVTAPVPPRLPHTATCRGCAACGWAPQPTKPDASECSEPLALGFDIETASADELFMGRHEGPFVRLVGGEGGVGPVLCEDPSALVEDLDRAEVIYGHNILGFDLIALAHHHGADYDALAAKSVDTMVLARLADPPMAKGTPNGYYGLDAVAQRLGHTGKSDDLKALAKEHGGYDRIPVNDERYRAYLRGDLAATQHVYETLVEMLPEIDPAQGMNDYARREMKVVALQNRMTLNGWRVDTELLAERVAHEDAQREAAAQALHTDFGMPLAPPDKIKLKLKADWPEDYRNELSVAAAREGMAEDPDRTVEAGLADRIPQDPYAAPWATDTGRAALIEAFRAAGAEHYPVTASGQLALSSDALGEGDWYDKGAGKSRPGMLKVYGHLPAVRELCSLITRATGATAKYAEILKWTNADGRVHPVLSDVQASGRWATKHFASSNLGKRGEKVEQRRVLLADPGHVLITCDMSQVDMRGIAGLCQDPAYMELFAPGRDAHSEMAQVYFGDITKDTRDKTKRINHKVNYGGSAKSTAEMEGLPLDLVEDTLRKRAEAFPRLIEWTAEVRELAASGALLDNGFGRLMRPDPQRAWTQGPALMGQGAARDLMCEGLLRLVEARPEVTPYLRGVVHDEVILSVPEDEVNGWAGSLARAFTFEWRGVPILCEVSAPGLNWADCYLGE